jgi:hypothetical protein
VHFDDRVIDVFARQILDPRVATRYNIARILIYEYQRLSASLGRNATPQDVDRYQLFDRSFYRLVFGSWDRFQSLMRDADD